MNCVSEVFIAAAVVEVVDMAHVDSRIGTASASYGDVGKLLLEFCWFLNCCFCYFPFEGLMLVGRPHA